MSMPIGERWDIAGSAYVSGDFAKAKALFDELINESPHSLYGIGARYLRARGFEDGIFSAEPDLQKAYDDFALVREHADEYGSDGTLGCARVLFEMDRISNRDDIISLCSEAIAQDSNVKAMMLLGNVYQDVLKDGKSARRWYLNAFWRGLPWGMRFFARSHANDGNVVRAALAHAVATVASPFLVLRYGVRWPLK